MSTEAAATARPSYDATLHEHRECEDLIRAVERLLDHRAEDKRRWVSRLLDELHELARVLPPHFAHEESGVFLEICQDFPRFAERVERLQGEHGDLRASLQKAIDFGESLSDPQSWESRQFDALVQLFVAQLRRHSSEEDEIIRAAFWDDQGVGD